MKRAILYIRVSTDEQADKGYSLKHQEEYLKKYCEIQSIKVVEIFSEDYSAKTFGRPEFNRLLKRLKEKKLKADLLIFTKWDRFSRNAPDAYAMIKTLHGYGIEPQAAEQPLDLGIPENKIMLAFYLAAPEVENDRRALNVVMGMRRAKKEGRWMSTAPKGYDNKCDELGRKYIAPNETAPIIQWAFEVLATGNYSVEDIRRQCWEKGYEIKKSCFYKLIRNPAYCGKIIIPAYKNEEEQIVQAIHEPIISEETFYRVQEVLTPRRFKHHYTVCVREELPLRGFMTCPRCGKNLSGSGSTGGSGIKHYYYHCKRGCKERLKADEVNLAFANYLNSVQFTDEVKQLYEEILIQYFKRQETQKNFNLEKLQSELKKCSDRLERAQQMVLDGVMQMDDYTTMKQSIKSKSDALQKQQQDFNEQEFKYRSYLRRESHALDKLGRIFNRSTITRKQQLVRALLSENMVFQGIAPRKIIFKKVVGSLSL